MSARLSLRLPVLALASLALGAGCVGSWRRPAKAPGPLLWVTASGLPGAAALLAREGAGAREILLEVGELVWAGAEPTLRWTALRGAPRRLPVTLVIRGEAPAPEADAGAAAAALARQVASLRLDAESWGLVPVGIHLDVAAGGRLQAWAGVVERLRDALEDDLFVSASLERAWLADPDCDRLAAAADFLVAFLYGQRPGERDDAAAWDLAAVEQAAGRIEELGVPYYVAAVSLGSATHLGRDGEPLGTTTQAALGAIARHPVLRLGSGFSLQGGARRVYTFVADAPAAVGELRLRAGESLRVVATTSGYLRELRTRLARLESRRLLGEVYYRLPAAEERLSVPAATLAGLLAGDGTPPAVAASLELVERHPRGVRVRAVVENLHPESTELSLLDHNYVQVDVAEGVFTGVEAGDFWRFTQLEGDAERVTMRGLRAPRRLRLHVPVLEGGERVASGAITVAGDPRRLVLTASARFVLPDGSSLVSAPGPWRPPE